MPEFSQYKDKQNRYPFPTDDIDPKDKLKAEYCKKWAEATYSIHVRDQGGISYSRIADYDLYRLYGEGRQPTEKYLNYLCPKGKDGKRQGFYNISWDIFSVLPKFKAIVMGMFDRIDHDIVADAIDENSGAEKQNMELEVKAEKMLRDLLAPFEQMIDITTDGKDFPVVPDTAEELEMFKDMGAFKLKTEIAMEKAIKYSFHISKWKEIKRKMYGDLFDLGVAASRDFTDRYTNKSKARYVDPGRLVVRYSANDEFDNADYAGELVDYTMSRLKKEVGTDISIEELEEIITKYTPDSNISYNIQDYGGQGYDNLYSLYDHYNDLIIKVLDIEWKSVDGMVQESKTTAYGETFVYNKPYSYRTKEDTDYRKVRIAKRMNIYRCKWIVGSNFVWDYGQQYDIVRTDDKKDVKLSFNIFRLSRKSIVAQLIPVVDSMQLAWLKFQNSLAKAAPEGLAIDVAALENISIGGNKLTPLEVLTIRQTTGDLIYSATTHHSQVVSPGAGRSIIPIEGGAGKALTEQLLVMDKGIEWIRHITGISEIGDGSAPPPGALVGTTQVAAQATNNILHNLYMGYRSIKERTANNIAKRIQITARYKNIEGYYDVLGKHNMETIKIGSELSLADYGIILSLRPTDAEKQSIIDGALAAVTAGTLEYSDYTYLVRQLQTGSTKYAEQWLKYKEKKNKEQQSLLQQENMQLNQQMQEQAEQQKGEQAMTVKEADTSSKVAIEGVKSDLRIEEEDNRHENKMEQEGLKGNEDIKKEVVKGENQKEIEDKKILTKNS